ncbi:hypothetical protein DSCW_12980 [Desulfosarcina widdelii]|uniref:Uncharacterized protein n=1 Tax=Desulfosarcina widdelii TaxID=947919 RepID=A0A5K7Z2Y4_9BACT|nr:hypothetical protein DSCW_12980 [Desulfosarcina widdelii]
MGTPHAALGRTLEHSGKGGVGDRITGFQTVLEGHRFPPNLLASKQMGFKRTGVKKPIRLRLKMSEPDECALSFAGQVVKVERYFKKGKMI